MDEIPMEGYEAIQELSLSHNTSHNFPFERAQCILPEVSLLRIITQFRLSRAYCHQDSIMAACGTPQ
jgi:hypothetical protein